MSKKAPVKKEVVKKETAKKVQMKVFPEARDAIKTVAEASGVEYSAAAIAACKAWHDQEGNDKNESMFNDSEQSAIDEALEILSINENDFMRQAVLTLARKTIDNPPVNEDGTIRLKAKGSVALKLRKILDEIVQANKGAKQWHEMQEITQRVLQKASGSNMKTVKNFLEANRAEIDAHHKKLGFEPDHNTRAAIVRRYGE